MSAKSAGTLTASVGLSDVPEILHILDKAKITPNLVGVQGIGKSDVIRQYAKQYKFDGVIDIRLGQMEVGDLVGLPRVMDNGKGDFVTVWGRPCWWPTKGKYVVFFDEWNRAGTTDVIQAVFQVFLDRKLHTHELPDGCQVICAMNPADKGFMVNKIKDKALMDRLLHLNIHPTPQEFLAWARTKAADGSPQLTDDLYAFVQTTNAVLGNRSHISEKREPSARAIHMLSRIEKVCTQKEWDDHGSTMAAGLLGSEFGIQYIKFKADREYKPLNAMDILDKFDEHKEKIEKWCDPKNLRLDVLSGTLDNIKDWYMGFKDNDEYLAQFKKAKAGTAERYITNHINFVKLLPKDLVMKHFKEALTFGPFETGVSLVEQLVNILDEGEKSA